MKRGFRTTTLAVAGITVVSLLGISPARGQAGPEPKPLMAEQVHKNIQVLKGIPENEFLETMGFFSASLGESCTFCHVAESSGNWARYADDNENKKTARRMIVMANAINKAYFGGKRVLTCYSCHRGGDQPRVTPSIAELYGPPLPEEPDQVVPATGGPSADQILDKYIQALGGAQKLAGITSFAEKGTYQGYGAPDKHTVEIFAKAPGERATFVHTPGGDSTTAYDGKTGWIAAPDSDKPVPVLALTGGDLDGAKVDAELSFPARIKQVLSDWRVGYPITIDDRDVQVVQGMSAGKSPVKLFFDKQSGLLVRVVRYADSPIGLNPTQIDYSDYRDVAGVKMPFKWTVSWLDGRSITELSEVKPNVPVDAAKFAKPAPPAPPAR
jgi:photosynthetic reaction center cytochrome c subunit